MKHSTYTHNAILLFLRKYTSSLVFCPASRFFFFSSIFGENGNLHPSILLLSSIRQFLKVDRANAWVYGRANTVCSDHECRCTF